MASSSKKRRLDDILLELDQRDDSQLLPKHAIFLCHSGAQKGFVEQLYVDLKSHGHSPFFDQCPESLPKGEVFAERIFEAAKQCRVAVVVLSNEFLVSQWPMLELATFVEAQKTNNPNLKIFPLFYKLEVLDLKDAEATETRMAKWKEMAVIEERINPDAWMNVVTALARANGEVFSKYGGSEVRYRKAIVDTVCELCRPYVESTVPSMVGRDRLCKIIEGEYKKMALERGVGGPQKLGLYGQGGMGKTFICKALCDHFDYEYSGRVCYIEYSNGGFLELLKIILEELTDVSDKVLRRIKTNEQADEFLRRFLPKQDVFLALDNLQDDDLDWPLLKYLSTKSKVVVTSRSLVNVRRVLGDDVLCLAMPTLIVSEALKLFVQSAGCTQSLTEVTDQEMEILMKCVEQGFFKNDLDSSDHGGHYNPLFLEAMGFTIKENNTIELKQLLKKCSCIQNLQSYKRHTLSNILNPEYYSTLTTKEKQLLFVVVWSYSINNLGDVAFVELLDCLLCWMEVMEVMDGSSWKEIVHKLGKLKDFHRVSNSHKKPLNHSSATSISMVLILEACHKLDVGDEDKEGQLQCMNKVIEILSVVEDHVAGIMLKGNSYKLRGIARRELDDVKGSLEDFEKANQFMPDDAQLLRLIGVARTTLHQLGGAMEAFNRSIHLKSDFADSFASRAIVKIRMKDWEGAVMDINEALRIQPDNERAQLLNDALSLQAGQCERSKIYDFLVTKIASKSRPLRIVHINSYYFLISSPYKVTCTYCALNQVCYLL